MENQNYNYLNRKAVLAAMISAAFPIAGYAAAGKVEFASGGATIQSADGSTKVMTKGMEINQGDTILTGSGRAQVKFSDGGYISFQPNTQFKIEEYNYNGKQDGTERGFFRLVQGGLRALTGFVGRENRPNYRMATPVATIGIRGSYYLAEFQEKLKTHVGHGSIYVFNEQGDIILFEGQGATVEPGKAPGYSDQEMTLGARGPEGGQPSETKDEQQASSENTDVFKVSEQYGDNGSACLTADCNAITATIANLNGMEAQASYALDANVKNVGGNSLLSTKVDYLQLYADFKNYKMDGYIGISEVTTTSTSTGPVQTFAISSGGGYVSACVGGSILPNGSFGVSGSGYGSLCNYGSCDVNVIGLFNGPNAEKANIGYSVNGTNGNTINGGNITGTAGAVQCASYTPAGGYKYTSPAPANCFGE